MSRPEWVLLLANLVYATSPAVTRLALDAVPPSLLALCRVVVGTLVLIPVAWASRGPATVLSRADHARLAVMGLAGFAGAFALFHWGLERSTATNAALLITVEPVALILLAPAMLGERLTRREAQGAALALVGATLVVVNGIPGVTHALVPHGRGDLLLVLSGVAYAVYSLLGREVLARHRALPVTVWSIRWGCAGMAPLAAVEWWTGHWASWGPGAVAATAYLAVVITGLGYLAWNYALERVKAPRVAVFLNLQPLVGALLGTLWLGEPLTGYTVAGGALLLAGLSLTVRAGQAERPSRC
jgi:drug/metabolite transporter (DMT)-like permease